MLQLLVRPLAVDHKDTARLDILYHLKAFCHIGRVVACHKVSLIDIVRASDRFVAES